MAKILPKVKVCKKNKLNSTTLKENLEKLSQEELIEKVLQLEAHNIQLKNILQKQNKSENDTNNKVKKEIDFSQFPKRHVLLKFYYLGWDYQGYVTQEDTNNTIEYFLFKALKTCCLIESREKSNYNRCGRTDKGVSAFSQVISIDLKSRLQEPNESNVSEEYPYCSMLNRLLPPYIKCYAWSHIEPNLSARFDCSNRTYRYYFPKGDLNVEDMQEASKFLLGIHDFRNLCKMDVGNGVTEFIREIEFAEIKPCAPPCAPTTESSGYQMYRLEIRGKSFLWHQIRCIMGILLLVGQGKESPVIIQQLLDINQNSSKPQYSLASYLPLNLYEVDYESIQTKWITDDQDLEKTIKLLQNHWTEHSIKCKMIKDMIEDLKKLSESSLHIEQQAEMLLEGVKTKVYKPLLSRVKCDSLESKINHYIKKRKIEVVNP